MTEPAPAEFLLYQTEDGQARVEVRMVSDTVWLSLNQLSELFGRDKSVVSRHIKNVFDEGELLAEAVVARYATTAADGKTYQVDHYNLDVIISVGYQKRAKSVLSARLESVVATLRWVRNPPPIRFQTMKVQWGSCSPSGRLTLNPQLVKAPRECIDYVLLHELCHLREHNHGKRFYRILDIHMPRWRERKQRLDNLAETLLNI